MKCCFYYDESEHSRKINLPTITGDTYYDNCITAFVGWDIAKEQEIKERYLSFEKKYDFRKSKGELKSETFHAKQFTYGFASLNKDNIKLLDDFLSFFDNNCYIYLSVISKLEYIIAQIFKNYHNSMLFDMDAAKYSIAKAILTYRPENVLLCIYKTPKEFVNSLTTFLSDQIKRNQSNPELKNQENEAFKNVLHLLQDVEPPLTFDWDYHIPFVGFSYFLKSKRIYDYTLILDKEGKSDVDSNTLVAARQVGLKNCSELDSKLHFGIRIADMLAGIVGKLMKALRRSLTPTLDSPCITKTLLNKQWFKLNADQLQLYKKLYHIIFEINNDWFKIYSGNYSDDLISLLGLLEYLNHFNTINEIENDLDMQPEYCNNCMCKRLETHFYQMHNKLPIEPVELENNEFYRNHQGAKVFYDIDKQPFLQLGAGKNYYTVLSVGLCKNGIPLVTVVSAEGNMCYRLPLQLKEWTITLVGMANMGENLFPSKVIFTKIKDHIYVDIL